MQWPKRKMSSSSDTIHAEERSIAIKEYSLTAGDMLSNPMRHPKSHFESGHVWKNRAVSFFYSDVV